MQLPKRDKEFRWNLNTVLQLVTIFGMVVGGVTIWVNTTRDIEELQEWKGEHETLHKERLVEVKATEATINEWRKNMESDVRKLSGTVDNLSYRVTTNEQQTSSAIETVKEIQNSLAQQSGDLKVIKEILQRLEATAKKHPP